MDLILLKRTDGKVLLVQRRGIPDEYEFRGILFKKTRKKRKFSSGTAIVFEHVENKNEELPQVS